MNRADLTLTRLHELLDYNPETGVFVWRRTKGRIVAGSVAGVLKRGYRVIRVDWVLWPAHHLAWFYVHGEQVSQIDHKDRNPANNSIDNLRPCTQSQNNANTGLRRNNTSGFKGVHYDRKAKRWVAMTSQKSKSIYIGTFETAELAHQAYLRKAEELFGEFSRAA